MEYLSNKKGFLGTDNKINIKENVVIVEDIITTGGSVKELITLLSKYNANIIGVICIVNRSEENIDFGSPNLNQHLMVEILEQGLLEPHLAEICQHCRAKQHAMLEAADRWFTDFSNVTWCQPSGGLYVWMQVPEVLADSLGAMGRRYDLEQIGEFLLVGQERGGQRCWHIFSLGEEYLMSILQYGEPQLDGATALRALGLL